MCELTFGITTETQDAWGEVVRTRAYDQLTLEEIESKISQFIGKITQMVPAYSAVKVEGIPLYKRMRLGMETKSRSRQVTVYKIEIIKYKPPRLIFMINCSKGTYVRTICHDLGEALGVGGHLSFLLRTKVGNFTLQESIARGNSHSKGKSLITFRDLCRRISTNSFIGKEITKIKHGQAFLYPNRFLC